MIESAYLPETYLGNGSQVTFPFSFRILAKSDVIVIRQDSVTSIAETLDIVSDYNISDADVNTDDGGDVVMVTAPTSTETILIFRHTSRNQLINLIEGGVFPAAVITKEFDRLHMILQELDLRVGSGGAGLIQDNVAVSPNAGGVTVTFDTPMSNANYNVFMTASWQTTCVAANRTTTGFQIKFAVEAGSAGGSVVYAVSPFNP